MEIYLLGYYTMENVASFDFTGAHNQGSVISLKGDFCSEDVRIISIKTLRDGLDEFGIKECAWALCRQGQMPQAKAMYLVFEMRSGFEANCDCQHDRTEKHIGY